ncbi:PI-PLC X domain-containing protein [Sesamum angolense]|uniref:PI-PLC X domain-containing protein n=1 Tax=Sesamum angolense TaxID=2727404 RepID=A0AAE1WXY1_9LAMI|nr:PI-PLC X domain-containing protein [Sesamum angolense]
MMLYTSLLFFAVFLFGCSAAFELGEGQTCIANRNCDDGMHCETCFANGNIRPRCTRIQPTNPLSKVKNLPYNRYTWLTTHNSFARVGAKSTTGSMILAPSNQQDSITSQLMNAVRGLMLDMYDFEKDIWLCHSFGGKCYNTTAFVTGLSKFWFPVSRMPRDSGDWPTVADMIKENHRLVVFTSKEYKESSEGIAYEWRYLVENQYGSGGMVKGLCPNRGESQPMNATSRSLVLVNYFPTAPDLLSACKDNSDPLIEMTKTCYLAAGKRKAMEEEHLKL